MKKIYLRWLKKNLLQILLWALFIFYETVVAGLVFGIWGNPVTYFTHYLINISFFYFNSDVAFPWALYKERLSFIRLPFILLLEILGFILLNYCGDFLLFNTQIIHHKSVFFHEHQYVLRVLYRCIYFLSFSTAYYYLVNFLKIKKQSNELEKEKLYAIIKEEQMKRNLAKAHNSFLKAQINPHFLFNTLDYIYHNIGSFSQETGDAIIALSEIMRYAIDLDKDDELVILGDEIEQVEKLLNLYQLRKSQSLNIEVYFAEEVKLLSFLPFILLTLVENIFKHGNLDYPEYTALIAVYKEDEILVIKTSNLINNITPLKSSTKGLINIREQIKFAYGDNFEFGFKTDHRNYFRVELRISIESIQAFAEKQKLYL